MRCSSSVGTIRVYGRVVGALARYAKRTVSSVVLLSAGDKATTAVDGADATLRSGDAIAYDTYGMSDGQTFAVIVRPYGAIGAIVSGDEGWVYSQWDKA
ncbi:hypothetical protein C8Q72DRAFT_836910 [Fomitopsis betulina]|nr:hypothetical protein C8Q72DRAFT_836910 [Fomitopsis betulina]